MKDFAETTNHLQREPIHFAPRAIAVIQVFTRLDEWEDMWMDDVDDYQRNTAHQYERAAKQFIDQLKDEHCIAFLEALKNECERSINVWKDERDKRA